MQAEYDTQTDNGEAINLKTIVLQNKVKSRFGDVTNVCQLIASLLNASRIDEMSVMRI